jgi:hypothetical protein
MRKDSLIPSLLGIPPIQISGTALATPTSLCMRLPPSHLSGMFRPTGRKTLSTALRTSLQAPDLSRSAALRTSKLLPRRQPRLVETASRRSKSNGAIPMKSKRLRLSQSISTRSGRAPGATAAFMCLTGRVRWRPGYRERRGATVAREARITTLAALPSANRDSGACVARYYPRRLAQRRGARASPDRILLILARPIRELARSRL